MLVLVADHVSVITVSFQEAFCSVAELAVPDRVVASGIPWDRQRQATATSRKALRWGGLLASGGSSKNSIPKLLKRPCANYNGRTIFRVTPAAPGQASSVLSVASDAICADNGNSDSLRALPLNHISKRE